MRLLSLRLAAIAVLVLTFITITEWVAITPAFACTKLESQTGTCPERATTDVGGGQVVIEDSGTRTTPGTPGASGGRGGNAGVGQPPGSGGGGSGGGGPVAPAPPLVRPLVGCGLNADGLGCTTAPAPAVPAPDEAAPGEPLAPTPPRVITVADLVGFRPPVATAHMEPNGWAVVRLPANFYATVEGPRVQTGTLLGQAASVRFTPVGFTWDYGDGARATVAVAGSSWQESSLQEFTRTQTSHEYEDPGDYRASLTAHYAAEYRYAGNEWIPVAGILPVASGVLALSAGTAETVLVERECTQNPRGPGC